MLKFLWNHQNVFQSDHAILHSHQQCRFSLSVVSNSWHTVDWAHQAPLSMGFPRQECWGGLPFPSPGDSSCQGSNPGLLHCSRLYWLIQQGSSMRGFQFPRTRPEVNPIKWTSLAHTLFHLQAFFTCYPHQTSKPSFSILLSFFQSTSVLSLLSQHSERV